MALVERSSLGQSFLRGTAAHDTIVRALAAAFLGAHLASLTGHVEDIDSINFALALERYDVAAHQPHPPGYPVFILLARAAAVVVRPLAAEPHVAAVALALLAAIAGGVALLALNDVLASLEHGAAGEPTVAPRERVVAVALTAAAPLFWITASRPLSDMPGLAGALAAQALVLRAARASARPREALLAALACGLATGLRSQVAWLVVPLLLWLLLRIWRARGAGVAMATGAAALTGVLLWAVPMVAITGGAQAYREALATQAAEDFEGVPMLLMQPGAGRLLAALVETWAVPWGVWPLAAWMLTLSAAGVLALRRGGGVARWLVLAFVPYALFHLLLQETETTRYALPLVPACATLAAVACRPWPARVALAMSGVAITACLLVTGLAHVQYASGAGSAARVLAHWEAAARVAASRPDVLMHRRVWAETRRAREYLAPSPPYDVLPSPPLGEWQQAARLWAQGDDPLVWWMSDPRRGDRVAIDPRAQRLRERLRWPEPVATLLGGMRPHPFDWYDVQAPQWVLLGGWGLTPELAGVSAAAGEGPSTSGADVLVRRGPRSQTMVLGGRHIAGAAAAPVRLEVRRADGWAQTAAVPPGPFAFTWEVPPATTATSGYTRLQVRVIDAPPGAERVFLEQFDIQPPGVPVVALLEGWYEPERDVVTGRQWRWVAERSALRVSGASGDVRVVVTGTYPRHYDRAPVLEWRVGDRAIGTHTLTRPFRVEQTLTAAQLDAGGGRIEWRASPSFVAGERTGTADARRVAIEISAVDVRAVSLTATHADR